MSNHIAEQIFFCLELYGDIWQIFSFIKNNKRDKSYWCSLCNIKWKQRLQIVISFLNCFWKSNFSKLRKMFKVHIKKFILMIKQKKMIKNSTFLIIQEFELRPSSHLRSWQPVFRYYYKHITVKPGYNEQLGTDHFCSS